MKRFLLSAIVGSLVVLSMTSIASAKGQTNRKDASADLNGDGTVTLSELRRHNLDYRGK